MVTARMINPAASMYKLILMDYSMPKCDGPTATAQIRELLNNNEYQQDSPYICFLTAYSNKKKRKVAIEAGGDNYLVKPVFKQQIHKVLISASLLN